ncbi:hypothetical protein PC129_g22628 [Phytophthora cactorum]|uniref:RxLR effector protein n=1 Tax=Phytophthora cactorum TaxID=29920 RepID=A0A8T1AHH5_9STRA|nr:hypothetical protein Pcac1_g5680 [Phytophthora cactorum]KAG2793993.1 hypothetical protein PC111_g22794 [Phytophthora cactorum]KAG2794454.1 hypothetical protein PC112_g23037 [Phytophthora cactorum]KAG2817830.1 hypothetical protein PC113_g22924 [Phytophthora cactorum]KAG2873722.1 hypothetical protein PC114_g25701 [Phytophthora cactorum]
MHLHRVLLVTLFTLLATSSALVPTQETSVSLLEHLTVAGRDGIHKGRSLRLAKTSDEKDSATIHDDPTDADERANPISELFSKISDKIPLSVKTGVWFERGKPVEYVQEKLGMKDLKGVHLTTHKNFPRLVRYAIKLEEYTIWKLVRRDFTTTQWWNRVGVNKKVTWKEGMTNKETLAELKKVQNTDEFKRYKPYAIAFDDHIINFFGSRYHRPTRFIDENATPVEKMARAQVWAEKERRPEYVKEFLGLLKADDTMLKNDPYFQFYLKELDRIQKAKAKPT